MGKTVFPLNIYRKLEVLSSLRGGCRRRRL